MRLARLLYPVVIGAMLGTGSAHAASPALHLEHPADRTRVRGNPAVLSIQITPEPAATALRVEVDGVPAHALDPQTYQTALPLAPGLHRVAVAGRDAATGERLRSAVVRVAVFPEARPSGPSPRQRHGITAAVAFVLAVGGATALRRRSER